MAPYDSDSSDDEGETQYTETNVLLGYADPEDQDQADDDNSGANETVSRLGGRPDWLGASEKGDTVAPSAALGRCLVCKALLVLLLQLNGELPDRFPGHERRIYVLACRNNACRRKPGSMRAIRGVRIDTAAVETEAKAAAERQKQREKEDKEKAEKKAAASKLGDSVFGSNPFAAGGSFGGGNANPFAIGGASTGGAPKNPFSIGAAAPATPTPTAAPEPTPAAEPTPEPTPASTTDIKDLPKTFAETLSLNATPAEQTEIATAPAEPWPTVDTWPAAYPTSWIADAEYETIDPTPTMPTQNVSTEAMEVDDGAAGGSGGSGKEDKFVYESSMDSTFQKFADRIAQNPDQVIRYEFAGQPLLYNKEDTVAALFGQQPASSNNKITIASAVARLPPCPNCRAKRVFEVQLMPHSIDLLEANELGLEGMDWGTVVVGVCEKDCQTRGTASGEASYLEEWVGVQWEELQSKR
ncbi:pdcd2 c domain-containing protein [Ophiostoma piceae UAMH 11346]|uniref:Pdcd2 c domain-containing protein n=1 Tax=Ophiostoma piceae (strain UAMH 11346) TaxID=1262450 RepID=S3CWG5_OPHP1|nr:pdcd2 c domain-containing protein [Ophiostoma piceae UAMH 11346]